MKKYTYCGSGYSNFGAFL